MQDSKTFVVLQPRAFPHNCAFYGDGHVSVGATCWLTNRWKPTNATSHYRERPRGFPTRSA